MKRHAFIIGHPISHSRSPLIHRYWLQQHEIDGTYEAFDVNPDTLNAFIARIRTGEFVGGNVTVPLKELALAQCDSCEPVARKVGAVNTLVFARRRLVGRNTDLYGFLGNLDDVAPGWDRGDGAVVLGAGGAARAVLVGLVQRGFTTIHLLNRTPERALALAAEFGKAIRPAALDAFSSIAPQAQLLVNTSAVGMQGTAFENLGLDRVPRQCVVADLVYSPLETPLLAAARDLGLVTADGLGMLLHQAVHGFEAWFGARPEITPELRALVTADLEAGP